MTEPRTLKCGCSTCGCCCAEHSLDGKPSPCAAHAARSLSFFGEALALVALTLFLGTIAVWCSILSGSLPEACGSAPFC